jgi:hypothetical protein
VYQPKRFSFTIKPTVLYVREGEDSGSGNGITPEIQKIIDASILTAVAAAVEKETAGLKTKNTELLGSLKSVKDKLGAFGDLDPTRAKQIVDSIDNDEDTKLIAAGKKNEVIDKYTQRMRTEHETQLTALKGQVEGERLRANAYQSAVLDNQIRAVTSDCHKGAVDDALLHARQIFTLDAKGMAVKLNSEGVPELGKDGKTPFNPTEWMDLQRELKPHWFPAASSGSGSGGSQGAAGAGKTMKRSAFDTLTPAQQRGVATAGTAIID